MQRELFEATPTGPQTVPVRVDQVRLERGRAFGAVWPGWQLWRALELNSVCARLLPAGCAAVAVGADGGDPGPAGRLIRKP